MSAYPTAAELVRDADSCQIQVAGFPAVPRPCFDDAIAALADTEKRALPNGVTVEEVREALRFIADRAQSPGEAIAAALDLLARIPEPDGGGSPASAEAAAASSDSGERADLTRDVRAAESQRVAQRQRAGW